MQHFKILILILVLLAGYPSSQANDADQLDRSAASRDKYKNFADLAAREKAGVDYRITSIDHKSDYTVFAIHGGMIDTNTSPIARAIAKSDYNLYLFEGIKPKNNFSLHVTSSHFDEPQALQIAANSKKCLSIHGHKHQKDRICMGGNDVILRSKIIKELKAKNFPFQTVELCDGLKGTDTNNIVNRCPQKGVQLEFSTSLRQKLISDPKLLSSLAETIRTAIETSP